MSEFTIYAIPGSPFARSVFLALEEKGVHYRLAAVAPGNHRAPEHLARHPFGRVPVLQHGNFQLYETQAILRYIDRVHPAPALTPPRPQDAARMDQLMNINDWYLFQGVASVIAFQRIVGPRLMGIAPDEDAIAAVLPKARTVIDELALRLGDKRFFVNDAISLADVHLAPQLDFLRATPEWEPLTSKHANLGKWLDLMNSRPSMAATTWDRVNAMARAA
jgi:glutathione S-transferase